ncbi:preprotein translocase subunit YajC [Qipengyuania sp. MTN3-11]|uniref:preprotein translocase subunit YajC n=1 Tax=Qipengyuania sp. MTN3-11 TaxID=3056557 RepID=UPI0036F3D92D
MRKPVIFAVMVPFALGAAPLAAQSYQGRDAQGPQQAGEEDEAPATGRRASVQPYIEASQIVTWQMSPGDDVLTYTQLAAGVDAALQGRNNGASVSLRYERNFGYGDASDSDALTGLARGYATIVPNTLTMEAGALASRTSVDTGGANIFNPAIDEDLSTETYAGYVGPNLTTRVRDVDVTANYRLGYTKVDGPDLVTANGNQVDVFDESVTHSANFRAGLAPYQPLPIGVGVGAGYFQEDVDNLDQRVSDAYVRGDVTIPVTPVLAVVAGVGYENVEVSSRDAVRDGAGVPVIGADGRFVTDENSPRRLAFEAEGLIWDVGVVWRPSQRTALEAHYGHRYDSETFYGTFTWQPSRDTNVGVAVYDGISGFGGRLTNALAALPTDFQVIRDPVSGEIIGCAGAVGAGSCLDGALGSIRSSVFRSRGVVASYSRQVGQSTASIGAGYDRRNFIGAPGTILATADGVVDESIYLNAGVSGPLSRNSSYTVTTYASWFDSGVTNIGDTFALGSSAAYYRNLTRNLTARAAVALNYLDSELTAEDLKTASALVGLRYDF